MSFQYLYIIILHNDCKPLEIYIIVYRINTLFRVMIISVISVKSFQEGNYEIFMKNSAIINMIKQENRFFLNFIANSVERISVHSVHIKIIVH